MKKFIIALLSFTMFISIKAYCADTKPNITDFINSYGIEGERFMCAVRNYNGTRPEYYCIKSSEGKVVIINDSSNEYCYAISDRPFVYGSAIAQNGYVPSTSDFTNYGSSNATYGNVFSQDNNFNNVLTNNSNVYYYRVYSGFGFVVDTGSVDVDFNGSKASWDNWISNNPTNPNIPGPDSNNLPMLQFGLTKKTVLGFPQVTQIKEILTWDYTTQDIYKNNPTDFHMEMVASARWTASPTGIGNIRDTSDKSINQNCKVYITNGGCNISTNQYSWIYREIGKSLYAISGEPWDDNSGYFMYVRTVQDSTGKASAWKVYNLAMNGLVIQEDTFIEPDGTEKPLPDSEKDIGNGQGVQPAKFDNDSSTSSDSDPTSIRYDEGAGNFNAGTVISTLKSTVNQITELPTILTQLLAFLPSWLTSLMVIGIGLAVTIGVVKMILH